MKGPFQAVLFDLDGTLLDTVDGLAAAGNRMLLKKGFPTHPVENYRYFVGEGAAVLVHRALPPEARSEKIEKECLAIYLDDYSQNWRDGAKPYSGIIDMLNELTDRGVRLAVLSNKPHDITVMCMAHFFSPWTFEIVLGQRSNVPRKPDPAGAWEVAQYMNLPTASFLYMGDTAIDMKTSRAAGMFAVGVCWGFRPRHELKENGAEVLVEHPREIAPLVSPPPDTD